ncbi:MAG: ferrous iron transport protein A [Curvibacter sp.]|nr:ferrous iron transport protein A [Curvibacter sp.]
MASSPLPVEPRPAQELGLDELPVRTEAVVQSLCPPRNIDEQNLLLRLLEIGFLPQEPVKVIARGFPAADPIAVRVGHTTFALRRHEAALIRVAPRQALEKPTP